MDFGKRTPEGECPHSLSEARAVAAAIQVCPRLPGNEEFPH
jgi:hypothetical protein